MAAAVPVSAVAAAILPAAETTTLAGILAVQAAGATAASTAKTMAPIHRPPAPMEMATSVVAAATAIAAIHPIARKRGRAG
jgi:hypothetical protein